MQFSIDWEPPSNGTRTSDDAAASMVPHASRIRDQIRAYIQQHGATGATADEIECDLGLSGNTIRPRLCELRNERNVIATRLTRKTRSGRMATIYVAKEFAS